MVIRANHHGEGEVEVHMYVNRDAELTDVLVEFVSINKSILEALPQVTDDKKLIMTTLQEMVTELEGVLDKC